MEKIGDRPWGMPLSLASPPLSKSPVLEGMRLNQVTKKAAEPDSRSSGRKLGGDTHTGLVAAVEAHKGVHPCFFCGQLFDLGDEAHLFKAAV